MFKRKYNKDRKNDTWARLQYFKRIGQDPYTGIPLLSVSNKRKYPDAPQDHYDDRVEIPTYSYTRILNALKEHGIYEKDIDIDHIYQSLPRPFSDNDLDVVLSGLNTHSNQVSLEGN